MDYYEVAERMLKEGRKKKAFEEYKKTEEYKIRLDNKAEELKKTFESKRNTRILSLVESKIVPDVDNVVKSAVESTLNLVRTCYLAVEKDIDSCRKTMLNEMQHFDALDILERSSFPHLLYFRINSTYNYKSIF